MIKTSLLAPTTLAALVLPFAACQTTPPPSQSAQRFQKADTNHDGRLSRNEVAIFIVSGTFESLDKNRDGRLTKAEWMAGNARGQEALFIERDLNRDGAVTVEEAVAYSEKKGLAKGFIVEADTNKDGVVTYEEAVAYYASKEGPVR